MRGKGRNPEIQLLYSLTRTSQTYKILIFYLLLILLSVFWPFFHGTNDFNLLKAYLLVLFSICSSIIIFPLVQNKLFKNQNFYVDLNRILLNVFIIQTIIQIMAFISPQFFEIINFFKKESLSMRDYQGIRSLALTGNPFFSLSSAYGLMFISYFYLFFKKEIKFPIVIFCLLFVGSFFAGRTAFVGLFFGIILYIYLLFNNLTQFLLGVGRLLLYTVSIFFVCYFFYLYLVPVSLKSIVDEKLLPFAFEFIYSYQETGKFTTKSTDVLNQMYFSISSDTLLFGDGKYLNSDGSYYMHTDAGYMRNFLFYGILGFCFIVYAQISIIKKSLFDRTSSIAEKKFLLIVLVFYFVLHYKGEVLMLLPILQCFFTLYSFGCYFYSKDHHNRINSLN